MARKKRLQADHRADLRGKRFIGLPMVVKDSEAFRSLSLMERCVLIEILAKFNGYNNGAIVISHRQIAEELGNSNYGKISRAIAVLIERGFLDIATEAVWKKRTAREYRLTFISSGKPPFGRPATNEYLSWRKNDAATASAGQAKSADAVSAPASVAADTASSVDGRNPLICVT